MLIHLLHTLNQMDVRCFFIHVITLILDAFDGDNKEQGGGGGGGKEGEGGGGGSKEHGERLEESQRSVSETCWQSSSACDDN